MITSASTRDQWPHHVSLTMFSVNVHSQRAPVINRQNNHLHKRQESVDTVEFVLYGKSFEWQPYCHGQITRKIGGRSKEVLLYFPMRLYHPL